MSGCDAPVSPAQQYVVNFQNGHSPDAVYAYTQDTQIDSAKAGGDTTSLAVAETLTLGYKTDTPSAYRYLVQWQLEGYLPADVHIVKATVTLYVAKNTFSAASNVVSLHEIQSPWWDAYTSWTSSGCKGAWNGGNQKPSPMSTASVPADSYVITLEIDPALVEQWIGAWTENYGVLVKLENEAPAENSYCEFYTNEASGSDLIHRPMLTVYYTM
jgi:hypothetical protein